MAGYLIDTGVISTIRNSQLTVADWVGNGDLAVSIKAVEEVMEDLSEDSIQYRGNIRVLLQLQAPIEITDKIANLATDLVAAYARHDPPLANDDSVMAATALLNDRTLITKDRSGFHFIDGLRWIDANDVRAADAPLLGIRAPVEGSPSPRPCCRRLRTA